MSLEYLNAAFNVDLKGPKKAVLVALSDRASKSGFCYPPIEDTAQRSGLSERTVMRSVLELEKLGLITVIRETGKCNKYILLIEKLSTTSDTESQEKVIHNHDRESLTSDRASKNPCQSVILTINKPPITIKERKFFKPENQNHKNQTNAQAYKIFNHKQELRVKNESAKGELKNIRALLTGGYHHG